VVTGSPAHLLDTRATTTHKLIFFKQKKRKRKRIDHPT
jgi:hypothetical protein